jgi:citrate synthase
VSTKPAEQLLAEATAWWSTSIIDIHPGSIGIRGYPIQELIGELTFPQMIWLMLRGDVPTAGRAKLLEAALVAAVDHGPQAPSISISRMAVTCGLPVNGAMASAINALDDVHGGAGQQCMELMQKIAAHEADDVDLPGVVGSELAAFTEANGKIVPGFGHRFHPVDPRAVKLLALIRRAKAEGTIAGRYADIGDAIEATLSAQKGKRIPMNIDGATAAIYCELGFPPPLGRGLFILSRSVGILSHAWEQGQQGERIKGPMPTSIPYTYTGPATRHLEQADAAPATRVKSAGGPAI